MPTQSRYLSAAVEQEGEWVGWELQGRWFDPRLLLLAECGGAVPELRRLLTLTAPDQLAVALRG